MTHQASGAEVVLADGRVDEDAIRFAQLTALASELGVEVTPEMTEPVVRARLGAQLSGRGGVLWIVDDLADHLADR